jgi:RimJ/RimL family protein N-acetyltransferase
MACNASGSTCYRLRPLAVADVRTIATWYEQVDDLAMFHQRMPVPLCAEAIEATWRAAILAPEPRTSYWFAMEDPDGVTAGFGGLEDVNYAHGNCLAPFFVAPAARGKGLAVRLRAILLDLAFDQLALARLTAVFRADNVGSRRVNELCGLREEGRLRDAWYAGGRRIDVMIFGILADEWRAHRVELRRSMSPKTVLTLGGRSPQPYTSPSVACDRTQP